MSQPLPDTKEDLQLRLIWMAKFAEKLRTLVTRSAQDFFSQAAQWLVLEVLGGTIDRSALKKAPQLQFDHPHVCDCLLHMAI